MSLRGWCPIGVGSLVVALAVSGCGGQGAECSCSTAEAKVEQPALSSPVASVNADGPCMASTQTGADGGVDVHVEVIENITTDTGSCQVHETLADGTVLVAVLRVRAQRQRLLRQLDARRCPGTDVHARKRLNEVRAAPGVALAKCTYRCTFKE